MLFVHLRIQSEPVRPADTPNMKAKFLLALTALAAASTLAAQPISGVLNSSVLNTPPGGVAATDGETSSWTGTPTPLTTSATSTVVVGPGNGVPSTAFASTTATWAPDGNSGSVTLTWGWDSNGSTIIQTSLAPAWTYQFTADVTGTFNLNYSITATGDTGDLNGIGVFDTFDSDFGTTPPFNVVDPTASGVYSGDITSGNNYYIEVYNTGNFNSDGLVANGSATADLTFEITPSSASVPDYGSTALLVALGVAASLIVGRRKLA
jgi:hypothetical protein